jgi:hypothetical protein
MKKNYFLWMVILTIIISTTGCTRKMQKVTEEPVVIDNSYIDEQNLIYESDTISENGNSESIEFDTLIDQKINSNPRVENIAEEIAGFLADKIAGIIDNDLFLSMTTDDAYKFTSDNLSLFTGDYVFDSYNILILESANFVFGGFRTSTVKIEYDDMNNSLVFNSSFNKIRNYQIESENISPDRPFYWMFGDGAGYGETMYFFYKDGIAFYSDLLNFKIWEETSERLKYVVYYRKIN